jgi:transposase InsO family protein
MPWLETNPMDERVRFIVALEEGLYSVAELSERFGVSRQCGDKWRRRYLAEGFAGLATRSHTPRHCPHKISVEVAQAVIEQRHKHPNWGPVTLLARLGRLRPELQLPAPSTVGDLLVREGMVQPRRRRAALTERAGSAVRSEAPNQTWTADFKGQFRTLDGKYCYPLTIQDAHTRFLLTCDALLSTRTDEAKPIFERTFREYGLPQVLHTDNGPPFAAPTLLRLSRLNVWWITLGITPERSRPGCPQDNPRHERMHGDLNPARFPPAEHQEGQQLKFDAVREEIDYVRPHGSLGLKTPAEVYAPSDRAMPERIPEPEYPAHYEVRQVRSTGIIRLHRREIFISEVLPKKAVGLEEVADGIWSVFFYHVLLARYDERDGKLHP